MKEQTKGDTMKFQYVIHTQNLEEYGENFHKFKVVLHMVGATKDDSGIPSVSEASCGTVKHVNRYNVLEVHSTTSLRLIKYIYILSQMLTSKANL